MVQHPIAEQIMKSEKQRDRPHLWPAILGTMILMGIAIMLLGTRPIEVPLETVTPTTTNDRESRVYTISYRYGVFSPTNLRIHVGDTVRWKNENPLPLRVIAQLQASESNPRFDSVGSIQPSSYFSYTFSEIGVFGYYNSSDAGESGVVIVRE